jgi:hypothetical protein
MKIYRVNRLYVSFVHVDFVARMLPGNLISIPIHYYYRFTDQDPANFLRPRRHDGYRARTCVCSQDRLSRHR